MSKHPLRLARLAVVVVLAAAALFGAVPDRINYQGSLSDSEGQPVSDTLPMDFAIYNDSDTGSLLWAEGYLGIAVKDGVFSVELGSDVPIPDSVFAAAQVWLEIIVDGETIWPRTRLVTTPYSYVTKGVNGDVSTAPGELTVSDVTKGGGYLQMRSTSSGNYISMLSAAPTDEGGFSMYDGDLQSPMMEMRTSGGGSRDFSMYMGEPVAEGRIGFYDMTQGMPDTCLQLSFSPSAGARIRLGKPGDEGVGWLEMKSVPSVGASIKMGEPGDQRTLLEISSALSSGASIKMFNPQPEPPDVAVMELFRDGLVFEGDCGGKATTATKFAKCGMEIGEPDGETLFVANQTGIFMKAMPGKAVYDTYLTPTGFKLSAGATDGYVMTCDTSGVGSWQPAPGGSMSCGVAQAVDDTDFDTLYSSSMRTFISQSINCPSSGYVLVIGSCHATVRHHGLAGDPRFMFGVSDKPDSLDADQRKEWRFPEEIGIGSDYYSEVISAQKIYPVTASVSTFYMAGYRSSTTGCTDSCWVDNKTLSLVFVPEAYGTVDLAARAGDYREAVPKIEDNYLSRDEAMQASSTDRISQLESQVRELRAIVDELLDKQK